MACPVNQDALRQVWLSAPAGRLCPWEVAKALGLREASRELHGGQPNLEWIASRVTKSGGGAPTRAAMHELFAKIDSDPEWFPGKHSGAKRGPKPLLTAAKCRLGDGGQEEARSKAVRGNGREHLPRGHA